VIYSFGKVGVSRIKSRLKALEIGDFGLSVETNNKFGGSTNENERRKKV